MDTGAGFPDASVSILCMQNAALSRQERSSVLANTRKSLKCSDVATANRRFFGAGGGAARHETLITEERGKRGSDKGQEEKRDSGKGLAYGPFGSDKMQEACATYEKAKEQGAGQQREEGLSNAKKDKAKWSGPH